MPEGIFTVLQPAAVSTAIFFILIFKNEFKTDEHRILFCQSVCLVPWSTYKHFTSAIHHTPSAHLSTSFYQFTFAILHVQYVHASIVFQIDPIEFQTK